MDKKAASPESPFAKYDGKLILGNREIDCYVLDTEARVISLRATVKAISGDENGDIAKYVGIKALQPYVHRTRRCSLLVAMLAGAVAARP